MSSEAHQEYQDTLERINILKIRKKVLLEILKAPDSIPLELEMIERRLIAEGDKLRRAFAKVTRQNKR
jgi:hypothetical protein